MAAPAPFFVAPRHPRAGGDPDALPFVLGLQPYASLDPRLREDDEKGYGVRDDFQPCVYILASGRHGTLYIGVTSHLLARVIQHREGAFPGFTKRYGVHRLVWYAVADTMDAALHREKQLKKWNRDWKCRLIEEENPEWDDLAIGLGLPPHTIPAKAYATDDIRKRRD